MEAAKQDQGGKKKSAGLVVLTIIILILIGVILYLVWPKEEEDGETRNVVVTRDNVEEVIAQMAAAERTPAGYYTATMNYEWHFPTGTAPSTNAYVENSVQNTNAVFFDVFLSGDEEEAVYKSPVLPVGSSLQGITLDADLDAGTYDCIVVYHLVDDGQNTLSTLRLTLTIVVEG